MGLGRGVMACGGGGEVVNVQRHTHTHTHTHTNVNATGTKMTGFCDHQCPLMTTHCWVAPAPLLPVVAAACDQYRTRAHARPSQSKQTMGKSTSCSNHICALSQGPEFPHFLI